MRISSVGCRGRSPPQRCATHSRSAEWVKPWLLEEKEWKRSKSQPRDIGKLKEVLGQATWPGYRGGNGAIAPGAEEEEVFRGSMFCSRKCRGVKVQYEGGARTKRFSGTQYHYPSIVTTHNFLTIV